MEDAVTPTSAVRPPRDPTPAVSEERPFGVFILAVLAALGGLGAVLSGASMAGLGSVGSLALVPFVPVLAAVGVVVAATGIALVVFGIVLLLAAWGLYEGAPWAWTLAMVLALLSVVGSLLALPGGVVAFIASLFVVWYLTRAPVEAWCHKVGAWPTAQVDGLLDRFAQR